MQTVSKPYYSRDKPIPTWLVLTYVKYGVTSFGVPTESVTVTGPYEW